MQYAFQDFENLYLVMDLLNGGDLRYHVSRCRKFSEEQTSKVYLLIIVKNSLFVVFYWLWSIFIQIIFYIETLNLKTWY